MNKTVERLCDLLDAYRDALLNCTQERIDMTRLDVITHFEQCAVDAPAVPRAETVNHPQHYGGDTIYETVKVLEAWMTPDEFRGFCKGNAIKYLSRAGKKGAVIEDQAKARWYADRLDSFDRTLVIAAANISPGAKPRHVQNSGVCLPGCPACFPKGRA